MKDENQIHPNKGYWGILTKKLNIIVFIDYE
jgi:hypothetical protein